MQTGQSIMALRLQRISHCQSILGQPDVISISQVKHSTSFFQKDKRVEDLQENYINGLIFPTTAHFSSFISNRYRPKDPTRLTVKAKLLMFDAFAQKDIHIQISIPGSLEVRVMNLKGQPLAYRPQDYERAYFSSFLRSLRPMNYPNIILYPLLNRLQILRPIIKNFVNFSFRHNLRDMGREIEGNRSDRNSDTPVNLGLQLLASYCLQNNFTTLIKVIQDELKKLSPPKYYELQMRLALKLKQYPLIIAKTSQKLLLHGQAHRLKEEQVRALYGLSRFRQVAAMGKGLIVAGGMSRDIANMVLRSMVEAGEDSSFLKSLNLLGNLLNQEEIGAVQASYSDRNNSQLHLDGYVGRHKSLSDHPQLCFPFDNKYYNRLEETTHLKSLIKNNSKQGFTLSVLMKIQESLNNNPPFYDILVHYQKLRGWRSVVKHRAESFWLETDFHAIELTTQSDIDRDDYSFFEQSYENDEPPSPEMHPQQPQPELPSDPYPDNNDHEEETQPQKQEVPEVEKSFDGNLSEHEEQHDVGRLPKCSARVGVVGNRITQTKKESKILCGAHLQRLFLLLFEDIKLQSSLESWEAKLRECDLSSFSPGKKEITAMIFLKKALLHRKLGRNRKCEESLRTARRLVSSGGTGLVVTYQLILLYIQTKNVKGVEFYVIELIKLLKNIGIDNFDIVPEWSKPILQFVLHNQGIAIVKNLHLLFRNVFAAFFRSNHTEEEVGMLTQLKRARPQPN